MRAEIGVIGRGVRRPSHVEAHMQEISGGHALLHVAALSGSPRHCGLQSPRSYRACAPPLVLHLSRDAQGLIMR